MRKTICITIAVSIASSSLYAVDFSTLDQGSDQLLSRDEFFRALSEAKTFSSYDVNDDGYLTKSEFRKSGFDFGLYGAWDINSNDRLNETEFSDGFFSNYDENEDGHWGADEMKHAAMARAEPGIILSRGPLQFSTFDEDGDGIITEEEFNAARTARQVDSVSRGGLMRGAAGAPAFDDLDDSADGQLSEDELMAGQGQQADQRAAVGERMGLGFGEGRRPGLNRPSFADYDLNGNGTIAKSEYTKAYGERIVDRAKSGYAMSNQEMAVSFEDLDIDGDGDISAQEFLEHQKRRW